MERRVSAAISGRTEPETTKAIKKRITIIFCFIVFSLLKASSLPKLLVEPLVVQLFDEPVVVKRFRLRILGFGIFNHLLIQNFLDTFACVGGNLIDVTDGVLVNRVESFSVCGAGKFGNRAPAKLLVRK